MSNVLGTLLSDQRSYSKLKELIITYIAEIFRAFSSSHQQAITNNWCLYCSNKQSYGNEKGGAYLIL